MRTRRLSYQSKKQQQNQMSGQQYQCNLKLRRRKGLQPLMPIEITNVQHQNVNTFHRKCLLKQGNRGISAFRIKIRDSTNSTIGHNIRAAHSIDSVDNILSGSSIKSVHLKKISNLRWIMNL
ncbi:ANK_REP_REGION domain-containing protein [Caerostris extrusa]|uniref:ANK_REP_REGION domain-containing protein n=1 Tax=Caerostris extrusa TaxID=172846 RepID=A0AAV4UPP1_CAEEX|nr:ANK_REP_REGION domain-containing protein [Caerostris extrusa]